MLARFREPLAADEESRAENGFILAAVGESAAVKEARRLILNKACEYGSLDGGLDPVDNHTWCVASGVMRLAAYYTWLEALDIWTPEESAGVAARLIRPCTEHGVSVTRARTPGGHNQALPMALTSAVVGAAFETQSTPLGDQARALKAYGLQDLPVTLGLMDRDGYTGAGSTYQSHVLFPLIMWTSAFLAQIHDPEILSGATLRNPILASLGEAGPAALPPATEVATHGRRLSKVHILSCRWEPSGVSLLDLLSVEELLGSPVLILPPWDHYGWQEQVNMAAIAYWAGVTGTPEALARAEAIWDRPDHIAWGSDGRMWTLLYWAEGENGGPLSVSGDRPKGSPPSRIAEHGRPIADHASPLTGWSLPSAGAAIDHAPTASRAMMVWDRCAGDLQGIGRAQMNPNHLMYEVGGVPLFGDGVAAPGAAITPYRVDEIVAPLSDDERNLIVMQYGSLEKWVQSVQPGFLGAANVIVPDGADAHFQRHRCAGQLCHEVRTSEYHGVTAEAVAFYQPRFDLTRVRRTLAVKPSGLVWAVDDLRAQTAHAFRWQLYLRRQASLKENGVRISTPEGVCVTMAWLPGPAVSLHPVAGFPEKKMAWPEDGSQRLELAQRGATAGFVVCWLPQRVEDLTVRQVGDRAWRAEWQGGADEFILPAGADNPVTRLPEIPSSFNDLDAEPFDGMKVPTEGLLAALTDPAPKDWRRTAAAMQTLVMRGDEAALPLIQRLLTDPAQRYQVHSVAAWCLGRAAYRPALDDLRLMAKAPECNTALRAHWAVERITVK